MSYHQGQGVRLGKRSDFVRASFEAAEHVDPLVHRLEPDALPWVLRFALIRAVAKGTTQAGRRDARHPSARMAERLARESVAAVLGHRPAIACSNDVMFVAITRNQVRALSPVYQSLSDDNRLWSAPTRLRPRYSDVVQRLPEVQRLATTVAGEPALAGSVGPSTVWREALLAASHIAAFSRLLGEVRPRVVVVANQHFAPNRAILRVARESGVRTVYIPHAPVATNAAYLDLPVDLALLRGPQESHYYQENGVRSSRLLSVGTPSLPGNVHTSAAPTRAIHPPVFAPSPLPETDLRELLDLVISSTRNFVVSLHPAMGRSTEALFTERGCQVDRGGSTWALLCEGTPALLQSSSGVGLEALATGTPVIDLTFPGRAPNYPYIRSPHVTQVSDTAALVRALARAAEDSSQAQCAADLAAWAGRWTKPHGEEAARRAIDAIRRLADVGTDSLEPVFDATKPAGP